MVALGMLVFRPLDACWYPPPSYGFSENQQPIYYDGRVGIIYGRNFLDLFIAYRNFHQAVVTPGELRALGLNGSDQQESDDGVNEGEKAWLAARRFEEALVRMLIYFPLERLAKMAAAMIFVASDYRAAQFQLTDEKGQRTSLSQIWQERMPNDTANSAPNLAGPIYNNSWKNWRCVEFDNYTEDGFALVSPRFLSRFEKS